MKLLGREDERMLVISRLATGHVVLRGEAGVGKTTLLRAVIGDLRDQGRPVHEAVATRAAASVPFGALLSLIPDEQSLADPPAARQLLAQLSKLGPMPVLAVDDAHLLDDPSAAVVFEAARTGRATIILTLRSGEPMPDAITSVWKDADAEVVELGALTLAEAGELLERQLDGRVEAATIERLWSTSRGNPLFLRELLAGAERAGVLRSFEDTWVLSGDLAIDARLSDAVMSTIGALTADVRHVSELVAAGERIPLTVVEQLVDLDLLARAEATGVISVDTLAGIVTMAHPLYGEVLRLRMPNTRVRQLRATLAQQPAPAGPARVDPLLRAVWVLDGGGAVDPGLFTDAALSAVSLHQYDLARRLGHAVLALGPHAGAAIAVATAANRQRDPDAVVALVRGYPGFAMDGAQAVRLAAEETTALFWVQSDVVGAEAALDAWCAAITEQPWHDMLEASRATVAVWSGARQDARRLASELATDENDPRVRVVAFAGVGYLWLSEGRSDQVIDTATQLLGTAMSMRHLQPDVPTFVVGPYLAALLSQGRFDEVEVILGLVEQTFADSSDLLRAMALGARAVVALARGRARTARALMEESIAIQRAGGQDWRAAVAYAALAEAAALCGDATAAHRAMTNARASLRDNERSLAFLVERAGVWTTFVREGTTTARHLAEEEARIAHANGWLYQELLLQFDTVRLGSRDAGGHVARIGRQVDGPLARAMVLLGEGIERRDANGLDKAAAAFGSLGALLYAAEAAVLAAEEHRRVGDGPAAARADALAGAWEEQCEGARSPVLELRRPAMSVLTAREREIVQLAARGRSNRELADELCVSVRTVEGHLARAYAKLGVTNRQQLAELLG